MQVNRFLKVVLAADALSCLAMGGALAAASAPLSELFGLGEALVYAAGLALLPVGLFILAVAVRKDVAPLFLHAIIGGNVGWIAASAALAAGAPAITALGTAFVLAQAIAVGALTVLESVGSARARGTLAAAG
jgi:hypothetical protein